MSSWKSVFKIFTRYGAIVAKLAKYEGLVVEIIDIVEAARAARSEDSPGGKSFTQAEYAEIGQQIVEALAVATPLIRVGR